MQWLLIRTFEYLFSNHGKFIWADTEALQYSNFIEESERNLEINIAEDTEIPIAIIGNSIQPSVVEVSDYNDENDENENTDAFGTLRNSLMTTYHHLKLPSWSGLNSMISEKVSELELTNIFNLPIIPGPPSDYSAMYTALMVAHGISA